GRLAAIGPATSAAAALSRHRPTNTLYGARPDCGLGQYAAFRGALPFPQFLAFIAIGIAALAYRGSGVARAVAPDPFGIMHVFGAERVGYFAHLNPIGPGWHRTGTPPAQPAAAQPR